MSKFKSVAEFRAALENLTKPNPSLSHPAMRRARPNMAVKYYDKDLDTELVFDGPNAIQELREYIDSKKGGASSSRSTPPPPPSSPPPPPPRSSSSSSRKSRSSRSRSTPPLHYDAIVDRIANHEAAYQTLKLYRVVGTLCGRFKGYAPEIERLLRQRQVSHAQVFESYGLTPDKARELSVIVYQRFPNAFKPGVDHKGRPIPVVDFDYLKANPQVSRYAASVVRDHFGVLSDL